MSEQPQRFASPSDCLKIIKDIETSMLPRSSDRAIINGQFNGARPFSAQEEKEHQIQVNANFLEGYKIAQNGILQMNTALLYKDRFFNAKLLKGKATKRQEWSEALTNNIHRPLKRGRSGQKFTYLMQNRNAALTLHGVGPLWWSNDFDWMPKFVALDDLLIPTDTELDFHDSLGYFCVNQWLTPWQLYKMTQGEKVKPGWNKELVQQVLKSLLESQNFSPDYWDKPEKMEELWKQRSTYLNSDAVPKVKLTTVYCQDDKDGSWWRKILVRENQALQITSISTDKFLYDGITSFADSIGHVMHMQFGDGSVVAPFKYRSVRGLGVLLYSVIELMNRLRCQFTQSVFTDLLPLIRIDNPTDRDRPKMLQMQPYGVIDHGIHFVPKEERHNPNYNLVEGAMNEFRQLMSESSASYVQDIDTGSGKEMTLGEAQIRLQSVNKMVSSMLMGAYRQEEFLYEEVLHRFFNRTSDDPEVKLFQKRCKSDGIPDDLMCLECWQVDITKAFGAGDQSLAQQEIAFLSNIAPQLDPTSQRKVRRISISVMTRNPELADELVPTEPAGVNEGTKAADEVFPNLMMSAPTEIREGVERRDMITQLLLKMEAVIQSITQFDNIGTPQQVMGLGSVSQYIQQNLEMLGSDPSEKEFTTAAEKQLGVLDNLVKGFEQRIQEQMASSQQDPEELAKLQMAQQAASQKLEISQANFQQKFEQNQLKFEQKMAQSEQNQAVSLKQTLDTAAAEIESMKAKAIAEIQAIQAKTGAEVASTKAKTKVEVETSKEKAAAQPATAASE